MKNLSEKDNFSIEEIIEILEKTLKSLKEIKEFWYEKE